MDHPWPPHSIKYEEARDMTCKARKTIGMDTSSADTGPGKRAKTVGHHYAQKDNYHEIH